MKTALIKEQIRIIRMSVLTAKSFIPFELIELLL